MSTPASFPQFSKLFDVLGQPSAQRMQNLLSNGDLLKLIAEAGPDLSGVDRTAFRALLAPRTPSIDLTPVSQYAIKLHDWNDRFDLGLTTGAIAHVTSALPDHSGLLQPATIEMTLGRGLQDDWEVGMKILTYELNKLGVRFTEYFDALCLSYFAGSEPTYPGMVKFGVALLDFQTFWNPGSGIVPREVRKQLTGQALPGLEVVWFLALNPQVFLAMDGKTIPYLWAPGLVVDSDRLPRFDGHSGGATARRLSSESADTGILVPWCPEGSWISILGPSGAPPWLLERATRAFSFHEVNRY